MKNYFTQPDRTEVLFLTDKLMSLTTFRLQHQINSQNCYGNGCAKKCKEKRALVQINLIGCIPLEEIDKLQAMMDNALLEKELQTIFPHMNLSPSFTVEPIDVK